MLRQCLVTSITKKFIFLLVLERQPLVVLQIQNFHRSTSIYLKIIKNIFEFEAISIVMQKNTNKTNKTATNFDLTIDSLIA